MAGGIRRSRYIVLTDEMTGSAARRLVARAGHTGRPRGQAHRLVERAGTPAEVGVTTPAERAETYLRLMAESELRRALAYPGYESPGSPGLPSGVRSAVRLSRPLLAPLLPPVRSAARRSGVPTSPWLTSPWLTVPVVEVPVVEVPVVEVPVVEVTVADGSYRGLGGPADAGRPGRRAGPVADPAGPAAGAAAAAPPRPARGAPGRRSRGPGGPGGQRAGGGGDDQ